VSRLRFSTASLSRPGGRAVNEDACGHVSEPEMEVTLAKSASPERWLEHMAALLHARAPAEQDNYTGMALFVATYLFLVDVSQSIVRPRFGQMRASLRGWAAALGSADRAALITFGSQVRTLLAPTEDRAALNAAIDALAPTDRHMA
jgi:hypothetical protein